MVGAAKGGVVLRILLEPDGVPREAGITVRLGAGGRHHLGNAYCTNRGSHDATATVPVPPAAFGEKHPVKC